MPDENKTPASEPETTGVVQPQTDPAVPTGQTEPDNQGITEKEKAAHEEREAFYQKKYQELVEMNKRTSQIPVTKPEVEPEPEPAPAESEVDPYSAEGLATITESISNKVVGKVTKILGDRDKILKEQEQWNAELQGSTAIFSDWASKSNVPQELQEEAVKAIIADFPSARPGAVYKHAMQYIKDRAKGETIQKQMAEKTAEAARKAKELQEVQQPAPGAAPPIQPSKPKTLEEEIEAKFDKHTKHPSDAIFE